MSGVSEYCNLQVLISSTLLQFDLCGMQGIFLVLVQFERYFQNSSEIVMLFFFEKDDVVYDALVLKRMGKDSF